MGSLLQRAKQKHEITKRLEGISAADQEDVRREIARIAEKNRLEVTPELLTVHKGRTGLLFPLLVNAIALATLIIGYVTFGSLFHSSDAQGVERRAVSLASAEGAVLSQLQEQVAAELEARDAEIASIRQQLEEIGNERTRIEAQVTRRESERRDALEQSLTTDIRNERTRLQDLGLSVAEVEARLARYETERRAEIDRQLAAYLTELRGERNRLVTELADLQSTLQQSMDEVIRQRDVIESEMQVAMQGADAEIESAMAQIAELESRSRRRDQVDAQILGFLNTFRTALQAGDLPAAGDELNGLRQLLSEPRVRDLRGEDRWQIDWFVSERLEELVAVRSDDTVVVDRMRERMIELTTLADVALETQDFQTAEEHYRDALAVVPQVLAGHRFLLSRVVEREMEEQASRLASDAASEIASLQTELQAELDAVRFELDAARDDMHQRELDWMSQRQVLERESEEHRADLLAQIEELRASAAEAQLLSAETAATAAETAQGGLSLEEIESLRATARRLEEIELRYHSFRAEAPGSLFADPSSLLSARRLLHDVLASSEIDRSLPDVARHVARAQDAHFDAGRDDAFAEVMDTLYAVSALASPGERARYLSRALGTHHGHPLLKELLEQVLQLVQDDQMALR